MPRVALLASLLFVSIAPAAAAPSTSQQLNLREYIAELDRCSATLDSPGNAPSALHKLRMSLPAQWMVTSGNQSYGVATDWLTGGLARAERAADRNASSVQQIRQQIAAHREAAQALARRGAARNLENARATLNQILAAKEFQALHGPGWFELLRGRIIDWIVRKLERLFAHGHVAGNVIAWTLIALAALLLILWAVRATTRASERPGMDLSGAAAAGQDSRHWLREARDAAARGDYRVAIHAAYWAAIARLEEMKSLPEDRSRTPRESLRLIRRESAEYGPLSHLTRRLELVWYGYRSADSADWTDAMQQLETLGCLRSSTPAIAAS